MSESLSRILKRLSVPLKPIPTGETAALPKLVGVRAVMFDLYGTLFISGSGEVGSVGDAACATALAEAIRTVVPEPLGSVEGGLPCLVETIRAMHRESHCRGVEHPEVDIVEVWRIVLGELGRKGVLPDRIYRLEELQRLAVEYEARANPTWPMPGLRECLTSLRTRGMVIGIISNAQFYTPLLFEALLDGTPEKWGIDPTLQYYSYRYGVAKPGLDMHRMAAETLRQRGIEPGGVLYVGNDVRNDVAVAKKVGFHSALFAGDARSLRWRQAAAGTDVVRPDLVLVSLLELDGCLAGG